MILLQSEMTRPSIMEAMTTYEFFWTLYVPVAFWLLAIVALFIGCLFKYTFGDWSDKKNPYETETLGMPRGFFRGILTITLLYIAVLLELANIRMGQDESNIHEFLVAFQMMIAFYFGSKVMHHITSTDRKKAEFYTTGTGTQGTTSTIQQSTSTSSSIIDSSQGQRGTFDDEAEIAEG